VKAKPPSLDIPASFQDADLEWLDDITIRCRGVTLRLVRGLHIEPAGESVITLFKGPRFIRSYLDLLDGVAVDNMGEVGVWDGGSAVFFWNLLKPRKLCCIELNRGAPRLTDYVERQQLGEKLRTHFGVDQADRKRLGSILTEEFGQDSLDLVIDDASHLYGPSLATFETLFPALREGGLYILEDWKTSLNFPCHGGGDTPDHPPLHQLAHDLIDISMRVPRLIPCVRVYHDFIVLTRGPKRLQSGQFSIDSLRESCEGP
jgi:hypothetical protein